MSIACIAPGRTGHRGFLTNAAIGLLALASAAAAQTSAPAEGDAAPAKDEWIKPIPVSFGIGHVLVSDYVFRGVNYSEYAGEGREKPNHQLNLNVEYDAGKCGAFGANFWFEWFVGQERLTPWTDMELQEVDYQAYWRYLIEPIGTTLETGWLAYTYPPLRRAGAPLAGDQATDYEWYIKLCLDDCKGFGTKSPVLNPYVAYYHDLDLAKNTSWWELGITHPFALCDCPAMQDIPFLKDLTLTPSLVLGAQHRYFGKLGITDHPTTQLANLVYGLDVLYNLSGALNMPAQCGQIDVGGFLNYSQALMDALRDELYGGLKVQYSW